MSELIEIRNETTEPIYASACRSKLSGMLYVHFGQAHELRDAIVAPHDYAQINVQEVEA